MKSSSGEVFSYFAIPVETFQSIVDQQATSGGVSSVAQNLVIKALTEEEVLSIADVSRRCKCVGGNVYILCSSLPPNIRIHLQQNNMNLIFRGN